MHVFDVVHRIDRRERERKKAREKDEEDRRAVAHAEPENGDRDPRQWRDGSEDLEDGVNRELAASPEAEGDTDGNRQDEGGGVAPSDAEEACDDVLREEAFLRELDDGEEGLPRCRYKLLRRSEYH